MILIVGATGFLGMEICQKLRTAGKPVKALVRSTADRARVEQLQRIGVQTVVGDLKDPASLELACERVTAVITTASSTISWHAADTIQTVDLEGQINLFDAARKSGVPRFIYTSFSGSVDMDCPLTRAKRSVEEYVEGAALSYTILRPTYFMELWLSPALGFDYSNGQARIYGSGQNKISWISLRDVAQFAIESLANPSAQNATLELGGPEPLSPLEVVQIFEREGKRRFEIEHITEEALRAQYAAAAEPLQHSFAALMLCYARGDIIDMAPTLRAFPLTLTSVKDYAQRMLPPPR